VDNGFISLIGLSFIVSCFFKTSMEVLQAEFFLLRHMALCHHHEYSQAVVMPIIYFYIPR
jgi:hypothetical protein